MFQKIISYFKVTVGLYNRYENFYVYMAILKCIDIIKYVL